jgi:hypothetical protein
MGFKGTMSPLWQKTPYSPPGEIISPGPLIVAIADDEI